MKRLKRLIESNKPAREIIEEATNAKVGKVSFSPDIIKKLTSAGLKPVTGDPYLSQGSYRYTKGNAEVVAYPPGNATDGGVEAYIYQDDGDMSTAMWSGEKGIDKAVNNIKRIVKGATVSADTEAFNKTMKALGANQIGF